MRLDLRSDLFPLSTELQTDVPACKDDTAHLHTFHVVSEPRRLAGDFRWTCYAPGNGNSHFVQVYATYMQGTAATPCLFNIDPQHDLQTARQMTSRADRPRMAVFLISTTTMHQKTRHPFISMVIEFIPSVPANLPGSSPNKGPMSLLPTKSLPILAWPTSTFSAPVLPLPLLCSRDQG